MPGRIPIEELPPELQKLVDQILEAAQLSEEEAAAVGRELRGHLADGLRGGRSVAELVAEFSEVEMTAALIKRSRRRLQLNDPALPPGVVFSEGAGWRSLLDGIRADLSYAGRSLRCSLGFTTAAIVTIALGVGVNTAIFSIARATVLSNLPLADAARLVRPYFSNPAKSLDQTNIPHTDYREWRAQEGLFAALATYVFAGVDLEADPPLRIFGTVVSEDFFSVYQTEADIGRTFKPEDFVEGAEAVVVLASGLWANRFDGKSDIVGTTVRFSGQPRTVIGVVDESTVWPNLASFWLPSVLTTAGAQERDRRDNYSYGVVGRLGTNVSLEQAETQLREMSNRVAAGEPSLREGFDANLATLRAWVVGRKLPDALTILLAAATFVFLIACTNVAGLLVTRASSRHRQLAVRVAMGARPWQLVRHLLAESLLLFLLGGIVGVMVAYLVVDAILAFAPPNVPRLAETVLETSEFTFAFLGAAVAGLAFGLYPALRARSQDPLRGLKESIGGSESRGSGRMRQFLVVAEVALSTVLLIGAGLMLRSLSAMHEDDPGFRRDHLATFFLSPPESRYPEAADVERFFETVTERLGTTPGIDQAASTTWMPLGGGGTGLGRAHLAQGMPEPPAGPEYSARWMVVDPQLFSTLGWPLRRGRMLTSSDNETSPQVALISESMARHMFPDESGFSAPAAAPGRAGSTSSSMCSCRSSASTCWCWPGCSCRSRSFLVGRPLLYSCVRYPAMSPLFGKTLQQASDSVARTAHSTEKQPTETAQKGTFGMGTS